MKAFGAMVVPQSCGAEPVPNSPIRSEPLAVPSEPQVVSQAQPEEPPTEIPASTGLWVEMRNGILVVNAFLEDGTKLPWRWISAFHFDGYPATWVEAKGVRYHMRTPGLTPRKRTERQLAAADERRP